MQHLIQKRFVCMLAALLAGPVLALPVAAEGVTNAVRMVTYFPVPYAWYNNIYITDKLDVGTKTGNGFEVVMGDVSAANAPFTAGAVNLRRINESNAPTLQIADFQTPSGKEAVFGKAAGRGTANLNFTNLFVDSFATNITVPDATITRVKAASASQIKFGSSATKKALPTGCNTTVEWVDLKFSNTTKSYLVCCDEFSGGSACLDECVNTEEYNICMGTSLPGQVKGGWQVGRGAGKCECLVNTPTYTAAVSGKSLTKGNKKSTTAEINGVNKSVPYIQQLCWDYTNNGTGGSVANCRNSKWGGTSIGADWHYGEGNDCYCDCSASSSQYITAPYGSPVSCTHQCYADYGSIYGPNETTTNRVTTCKNSVHGASWNDNTCKCDCGTYGYRTSDGKSCLDYCIEGNPKYDDEIAACKKADGGHWNTNKPSGTCGCTCTKDGKTGTYSDGKCTYPSEEESGS